MKNYKITLTEDELQHIRLGLLDRAIDLSKRHLWNSRKDALDLYEKLASLSK